MTLPLNLSLRYWLFFGVVWHRHHLASTKAGFVLQHSLLKAKLLSEEGPGKHTGSCCLQFRKGPRLYHRQGQSNTQPSSVIQTYTLQFCQGLQVPNICVFAGTMDPNLVRKNCSQARGRFEKIKQVKGGHFELLYKK